MRKGEAKKLFSKNIIHLDVFNSDIHVFFNRDDFNKAMIWRGHSPEYGGTGLSYHSILEIPDTKEESHSFFIGIFDDEIASIVHEATHITLFFCDFIGHHITKYDEIVPYLIAFITNRIIELKGKL